MRGCMAKYGQGVRNRRIIDQETMSEHRMWQIDVATNGVAIATRFRVMSLLSYRRLQL